MMIMMKKVRNSIGKIDEDEHTKRREKEFFCLRFNFILFQYVEIDEQINIAEVEMNEKISIYRLKVEKEKLN